MRTEHKKRKTFGTEMLEALIDFAESISELAFDRKAAYRFLYDRTGDNWPKHKINRHFRDLESRGYLRSVNSDSVEFTNKAKLKTLEKLSALTTDDHKNRFVSFDIPETARLQRDQFRRAIKQLGFQQIQKSLWVTDRNVGNFVEIAAYEYKVEKYVVYIVAEKTDIDGVIEKILHKSV